LYKNSFRASEEKTLENLAMFYETEYEKALKRDNLQKIYAYNNLANTVWKAIAILNKRGSISRRVDEALMSEYNQFGKLLKT